MNIERFYEENAHRRDSEELEFGMDWSDDAGNLFQLSWVEQTGELYVMTEFEFPRVEVLGVAATRSDVEQLLAGWPEAMREPGSLAWVRDRVAGRTHAPPGTSSSKQPHELDGAFEFTEPLDPKYQTKLTVVMACATGALAALMQLFLPRPDPVAAFIGCGLGMALMMRFTPMGRDSSEALQRSRAMTRDIGRAGRREVHRAVREGRAVTDPRFARYAVRNADLLRGFLSRGWVAASSIAVLWLVALGFAEGRIVYGLIGLAFIAIFPIHHWATRAKRLARVEAALAANRRLLDS